MPFTKTTDFVKSFPSVSDLTPEQQKKAMDIFNSMKEENPDMEDAMAIATAMKNAKKEMAELNEDHFFYVSMLGEMEGKTSIIEILKEGKVHDRKLTVTREMLEAYVKNFQEGVYGTDIQVNLRHDRNGEAAGWVKNLYIEGDRLLAEVEWTPLGIEKVGTKKYKFTSSELASSIPHHKTEEPVKNVLIGVALTNIPAVKGLRAVTLSEEASIFISNFDKMKKFKEFLAQIKAKKTISASELTMLEEAATAAVDAGEVTPEEAAAAKAEAEAKVEEAPTAPAAAPESPAAPAAGELSMQKLAESLNSLAEENKAKDQLIAELTEKQKLSEEKIELSELSEDVKKTLCLSNGKKSTGFKPDEVTVGRVAKFMQKLSVEDRKEFKEVLALHETIDFREIGYTDPTSSVSSVSLNEEMKKANEQAKERHSKDPSKDFHEHLSEIYAEMEKEKA